MGPGDVWKTMTEEVADERRLEEVGSVEAEERIVFEEVAPTLPDAEDDCSATAAYPDVRLGDGSDDAELDWGRM